MTPRELLASLPEGATPGPWASGRNGGVRLVVSADILGARPRQMRCDVGTAGNAHDDANAALIAAAPALRDALAEVLAENERLLAILACERGERAPEGWGFSYADQRWYRRGPSVCAPVERWGGQWVWVGHPHRYEYALEAIEAADLAAGVKS